MSFELILTRSFVPGSKRRLESDLPPLIESDFKLLMDAAPIRRRLEDGSLWLWHPSGMAWVSARFNQGQCAEESYISLALSYSHNQFLKVWADAFELAMRLSKSIGASVFEDWHNQEIKKENLTTLLHPQSEFVKEQAEFWKNTIAELDARMQAPLEYPLGSHDAVDDYFVFFLEPARPFNVSELIAELGLCVAEESVAVDRFAVQDMASGSLLCRVLLRPNDGALQIWPFYWMEPFSKVAAATHSFARALHSALGGQLFFKEAILTPELDAQLMEQAAGLGIEFFLWRESQR